MSLVTALFDGRLVKFAPLPVNNVAVKLPFESMRAFSVPLILKPKIPFPSLLTFVSAPY